MTNNGEEWSVYLDGEMTDEERAAFEAGLTSEDRALLESEIRLDRAITDAIADAPACPNETWNKLRGEIWKAEAKPAQSAAPSRLQDWGIPAFAAAAAIIIIAALFMPAGSDRLPALLELAAADVPSLEETSEVRGSNSEIEDFLRRSGLRLEVSEKPEDHTQHPVTLIGARHAVFQGDGYHRIQFNCCQKPVEVIAAPLDGPIALQIKKATEDGSFKGEMKEMDGFLITVVGESYHSHEVFKLVQAAINP